ncbi:HNH endonuclease [Jatrophihabitans sp. YIM 134969]
MSNTVADRMARIATLDAQRCRLAAEIARETAALAAQHRAAIEVEIATVPKPGVGRARRREHARRQLVAQLGQALKLSPWHAGQYLRWAVEAPTDTPGTFALLERGELSERRARIVFDQVAPLEQVDRQIVDAGIAANLDGWGDRTLTRRTRAAVHELDPAGACARAARAASERRVSTRPAPDAMAWHTLLAPMVQVVACRAALEQAVKDARVHGDQRPAGQIMADTVVERITGQTTANAVPLAVQLVITDRTLLGAGDAPARLVDGSPIPAPLARAMVLDTGHDSPAHRVRRLFCDPAGRLITAETASRQFTKAMADFVALRNEDTCTTAYCDAPIGHVDHHQPHTHGGPTSLTNARGMCVWCNETKADRIPDTAERTPTAPTRPPRRRHRRSKLERLAKRRIAAARRPHATVEFFLDHDLLRQTGSVNVTGLPAARA